MQSSDMDFDSDLPDPTFDPSAVFNHVPFRVLDASNEPTEKIKDKDTFHRLDALRYAAVGVTTPVGVFFG
jgi:hypothetical protein